MNDETVELRSRLREEEGKARAAEAALKAEKGRRLKTAIWSAIGGFLVFAIGGQWFPGYQLDSTAAAGSRAMADSAVREVVAELCAERFMRKAGLESRLAALSAVNGDWRQANYIREGKWALKPGEQAADPGTAQACQRLISERVSARS